ncbi:MAG: mucoidy inhibitor MuiA family protein [Pseudomonadota bacterium]
MSKSYAGLATLLLTLTPVWAQDVDSRIDAVTVYSQGALITRLAEVNLTAGDNTISLVDLPPGIESDNIRLEIVDGSAELGQIRVGIAERSTAFNAEIERLNDQIRSTEARLQMINDGNATAQLQLQFLQGIAQGYAKESWFEGARGSADINSWRQALDLLADGADDARKRIRDNAVDAVAVNAQLAKLRRELGVMNGQRRGATEVDVALRAPRAGAVTMQVMYFDEDAYWGTAYEARLNSDTGDLTLLQRGMVAQESAQSWENVRLTLSTDEPGGDLEAEELSSWFVNLRPREKTLERTRNTLAFAPVADASIEEIVVTGTRVETTPFNVTYRVPGRVTVSNESDEGTPFDLQSHRLAARLVTRVVPEHSEHAFLLARVDYAAEAPLPAADMLVFLDGAYVGETLMPGLQMGASADLPFGQDRRIDVEIRDLGGEDGEDGIISRRRVEVTQERFAITNRRAATTTVEVLARYPVSQNERVRVEVLSGATQPSEEDYDDRKGVVLWRKDLAPSAQWQIDYRYEISYPKEEVLLNR